MPWKNTPPDILAAILGFFRQSDFWDGVKTFLAALAAVGVGAMAKIADEVKKGERHKFFTVRLLLDVPAWIMVTVLTVGVSAYYGLPGPTSGAVGTFLGYVGPRIVDIWIAYKTRN